MSTTDEPGEFAYSLSPACVEAIPATMPAAIKVAAGAASVVRVRIMMSFLSFGRSNGGGGGCSWRDGQSSSQRRFTGA
ncbi:hypothetical protein [Nocardia bovistercoris]|uniref:Uncharacterized protein n=1 Tax=Nocardia bovistercoris TaxID=2785916 RepID=A0A931N000_9NOCA|nr:hypothetical protein [Nocardia bovistercoris]MBH0776690.1 hypothetical protein [Nocardia bovistercoris]